MCGIAGFISTSRASEASALDATRRMVTRMHNRGPDAEGLWTSKGVALGHRRLAILDLDTRANQPMVSADSRYTIVFNGEIYNFRELRRSLEDRGHVFNTSSDTEVILALFATEGEAMLQKLQGMFAFVIWDRVAKRAFAARDPYGIKPLYYSQHNDGFLFASQVKALLVTGLVSKDPDLRGQAGFWMLGSVAEPHTWFRDIHMLAAGHCAWIEQGKITSLHCWQDIGAAWRTAPVVSSSDMEIKERVRAAVRESVARHLVADVPVGVFLSGGIDSGALAGMMVEAGAHNLQGITIAYDEFSGKHEDEAPVAALIAKHYGIQHHIRRVTREEFLDDLPRILDAMDQPSIDGINTWFASKAVAELGLKVVVSGVGGDELFQGYSSFRQLPRLVLLMQMVVRVPGGMPLAKMVASLQAQRTSKPRWNYAPEWVQSVAGAWWLSRSISSPAELPVLMGAELAAEVLRNFDVQTWVSTMTGALPDEPRLALGQIESMTYMRNQLLRDSDWASMAHSIELRTPLVDVRLLQQVGPLLHAFYRFPNKFLLAKAPTNPLPYEVIARKKTGFGIPVGRWLASANSGKESGDSQGWAHELARRYEAGL